MPNEIDETDLDLDDQEVDLAQGDELEEDSSTDDNDDDDSSSSLSPQQIAELAANTALRMQPQAPRQALTPEELDAKLNRYKVSPDIVKLLRDPEADPTSIVTALQALVDGAAKHAVTSSQLLFENTLSPMQQAIAAQQNFVREQQATTFVKHVATKYPALAGKTKVLRQALEHVSNSGWTPPNGSKSAAQKQVALIAQQIIRQVDPSFTLKQSQNPNRQSGSFGPRRSGGGGAGVPQNRSGAASFLDHLR